MFVNQGGVQIRLAPHARGLWRAPWPPKEVRLSDGIMARWTGPYIRVMLPRSFMRSLLPTQSGSFGSPNLVALGLGSPLNRAPGRTNQHDLRFSQPFPVLGLRTGRVVAKLPGASWRCRCRRAGVCLARGKGVGIESRHTWSTKVFLLQLFL